MPQRNDAHGMILLPGGEFWMGTDDPDADVAAGERPARLAHVDPFWISRTAVSNEEFDRFARASGYITQAEQFGWSYVFVGQVIDRTAARRAAPGTPWWRQVRGASWRHPFGPGSSVHDRINHPVVHVSWHDATAYCRWARCHLLTEAQWEYAARGRLDQQRYPWGHELTPSGQHRMNVWQGIFPTLNTAEDGYLGTCPVDAFPPNDFGLFNVTGNVWEWCADWLDERPGGAGLRPGSEVHMSVTHRVIRGGSYLCHESNGGRYRVSARIAMTPESSTGSLGFRCARSVNEGSTFA